MTAAYHARMTRIDATKNAFIAGDWGTTHSRFMLCDTGGRCLDTRSGPGAAESRGRFAEVFDAEPPYTPRACIAQAWSVSEVLRSLLKTESTSFQ